MLFQDPQQFQIFKKNFRNLTYSQFEEHYRRVAQLGMGTFGSVFKAQSVKSGEGQYLAIKQFNKNAIKNFRQIIREVDNLRKLQHINIVRFYDCYIIDDSSYIIVIEYCERGNLNQILSNNGLTTDLERLVLIQQIAEGLAYAHQKKIVHRDLKPENIFIGAEGRAKIGDFGCSIQMNNEESVMASRLGSLAYMDKRVSDGDPYDMSVDIYSFGMIIFCIYKGKGIYDECTSEKNWAMMMNNIYVDYEKNMGGLIEDLPQIIKKIIMSCLQSDFTKRPKASEIAKIVSKEIEARKSLKSIVSSTMDDENIQDQNSLFALGIIKYCKNIQEEQRNSVTKEKLFELLHNYKTKFRTISQIENVNYIYPKTKEQFTIFVLFYYFFWLHHLENFISKKQSLISEKYPQIDINTIDEDLLGSIEQHLIAERQKYESFVIKSCRNIYAKLKLINNISQTLRKIVTAVSMSTSMNKIQYEQFQSCDLKTGIKQFYDRRLLKEYQQNKDSTDENDLKKLKILQELCQSLQ